MRTLLIINHAAAKARRVWPTIKKQLDAAGIEYQAHETKAAGDATTQTRAALKSGVQSIVVVGGDGTLSEVAEGFFEFNDDLDVLPTAINPSATLSILPAGTGDDFARGLYGRRAPLQEWIETLISHAPARQIDVLYGRCNGYEKPFICLNASTMGIGGETAGRVASQGKFMRNFSGEFRFVFAAVGALAAWRERRVIVTVDGRTVVDGPMNLVAVANALYAGGGMMLSPDASIDDGKLDVITASGLSRANVVTELSRIHTGGHVNNPKVTITQGTIVRIDTLLLQDAMPLEADGNVRGVTPVQFQVLPGALRFVSRA
ncbi:MAG TPA: diacylglycerol kinase family protein, partial [Pyrinomonadaceae bacterium]|nr:diacylglycerol kinase family protein [Pyrinomonadaceae bacterium]